MFSISIYADNSTTEEAAIIQSQLNNYDAEKSYNWLYNNIRNTTLSVDQEALATVALLQSPPGILSGMVQKLKSREDKNACWPAGACNVKSTSLAMLALALAGQDITKESAWLKNARVPALSSGEWWLVLKATSASNGTCSFSFKGGNKSFDLFDDKITIPTIF